MMFNFIVALPCEAIPLIKHFNLKQTHQNPFSIYQNEIFSLAISGVGSLNASACVMHLNFIEPKAKHWINLGVAGHSSFEIGKLVLVSKVSHPQIKKSFYPYPCVEVDIDRSALISIDAPSQDYAKDCLFDMEGYGFTFSASKMNSLDQVHLIKVVSDNSSTTLFSMGKTEISQSIQDHLPAIENYLDLLRNSKKIELSEVEIPLAYPIHLSETQSYRLKHLLKILKLHKPNKYSFDSLKRFSSSKDLLHYLEKELFDLPLTDL